MNEQELAPIVEGLTNRMALLRAELNDLKDRAKALPEAASLKTTAASPAKTGLALATASTRRKTLKRLGLALLGGTAAATAVGAFPGPTQARVIANRQSPVGLHVAPPGAQDPGGSPPGGRVYGLVTTDQMAGLNYAILPDDNVALVAFSASGTAINAHSNNSYAIQAQGSSQIAINAVTGSGLSTGADALLFAIRGAGIGNSGGIQGSSQSGTGLSGISDSGSGTRAESITGIGLYGKSVSSFGVYGESSSGFAGWFTGKVNVNGAFSASTKSFKIDHPLDPANQYLYHTSVESPDMKNIYDGVVTLDEQGEAMVTMPEWFEALNTEFRYQLTCLGHYSPVFIAEEVNSRAFRIAGGIVGQKISWQVTGIRKDNWANAYRTPVEQAKSAEEKNTYLHPELYGQPEARVVHLVKGAAKA